MSFLSAKTHPVTSAEACRAARSRSPRRASISSTTATGAGPIRPGSRRPAIFGMGCFWAPNASSGKPGRALGDRGRLCGGFTPIPPMRRPVGPHRPRRGRAGRYDPAKIAYEALLKIFWENHDPDPGHAPGQ